MHQLARETQHYIYCLERWHWLLHRSPVLKALISCNSISDQIENQDQIKTWVVHVTWDEYLLYHILFRRSFTSDENEHCPGYCKTFTCSFPMSQEQWPIQNFSKCAVPPRREGLGIANLTLGQFPPPSSPSENPNPNPLEDWKWLRPEEVYVLWILVFSNGMFWLLLCNHAEQMFSVDSLCHARRIVY